MGIWDLAKPVIAQVHGYCLAGGSELATGCDLVYMAEDAQMGYPAVRFGVPDMHFHAWFLGMRRAMDMMVTGDSINGVEAVRGLGQQVLPGRPARERDAEVRRADRHPAARGPAAQQAGVHRQMDYMGMRSGIRAGTELCALGTHTQSMADFVGNIKENGLTGALTAATASSATTAPPTGPKDCRATPISPRRRSLRDRSTTPAESAAGSGRQSAARPAALLHLECDAPVDLRSALIRWWEDFHFPELLTLPGFLTARRGQLIAPGGQAPIVTMYGLAEPAAADQPRPPEFTLMPSELDGNVTFNRRILQRISLPPGSAEPIGSSFLQLQRPISDATPPVQEALSRVREWGDLLSVSCWRSVDNAPHTDRPEVVHLRDTELILAELDADDGHAEALLARATDELPGWAAGAYRQAFRS